MRAESLPDHGSLALLAQNQTAELRPLLLRVHVRNFIDAPNLDPASIASFEAIALGLIPLVPDDALADAATMLRGIAQVPTSIRTALEERLELGFNSSPTQPSQSDTTRVEPSDPRDDLALARDRHATLGATDLSQLVEHAIGDPTLAAALLDRPEPSIFDRAALYRHADGAMRASIRRDLHVALASIHLPAQIGAGQWARDIIDAAKPGRASAVASALAKRLAVEPDAFDLGYPAGQELFLFAMMAVGLDESEWVRILLLLDEPASRSVKTLFRLVAISRSTSRAVAAFLAGYERLAAARHRPSDVSPSRASGTLRTDGRADPMSLHRRADRGARDRAPIARSDRRS